MDKPKLIKIALIGLGQQMQCEIVPSLLKLKDVYKIVAICDPNNDNLKAVKKNFSDANTYSNYEKLLKKEKEIKDVIVCLPHYLYKQVINECLDKKLNIFKEKPLAKNFTEAKQIYLKSQEKQKTVYTVTKRDFYSSYNRAIELIKKLGNVYQYTAKHYVTGGNVHEGWKSQLSQSGGGAVINLGYHLLKILIRYFGDIKYVSMYSSNKGKEGYKYEVEDAVTALILHKNGVYGSFQFNCYTGVKQESIEIYGTKGTMLITKTEITIYSVNEVIIFRETFKTNGIKSVTDALNEFRNLKDGDTINIKQNLKVMEAIEKLYKNKNLFY